jgi:hypothetical protein
MQQHEPTPSSLADVRERIQREWTALEETIGHLTETELTQPGPQGEWSVKDHLAHLTGWEQYLLAVLNRESAPAVFGLDQATFAALDTDGLNAGLHERTRDWSLADVLAAHQRTHERVLEALAALSDADLRRPVAEFWADPTDGRPVLCKIAGNTYEHYAEHRGWIVART